MVRKRKKRSTRLKKSHLCCLDRECVLASTLLRDRSECDHAGLGKDGVLPAAAVPSTLPPSDEVAEAATEALRGQAAAAASEAEADVLHLKKVARRV